ncbi:hypothetical protein MSG28_008293 [Choristoneura fumiferana]|uniref:Uncharacterized protein n=1 Tax=Choristoneura fumiferana TaxID=7141 RepID=A0ACC0JAX5_CHOFU|nr:hypothetical protein MSG28_008293 [Choristoneura fumiferana]
MKRGAWSNNSLMDSGPMGLLPNVTQNSPSDYELDISQPPLSQLNYRNIKRVDVQTCDFEQKVPQRSADGDVDHNSDAMTHTAVSGETGSNSNAVLSSPGAAEQRMTATNDCFTENNTEKWKLVSYKKEKPKYRFQDQAGVMLSSYAWGLCADTKGRRWTLLLAMPFGAVLNLAASMAPTYASLAVLKFLSAGFTASANAAAFVLVGETTPRRHRSRFMFLMASATMLVQFFICVFAIPVFKLTFRYSISWLSMDYRPWRLLMQIISLPGIIGVVGMLFLYESPKFLLSRDRDGQALTLDTVYLEEPLQLVNSGASFLRKMWDQTAPLFKPPLLKNNLKLYYILLCAYMTSTGYTMWVPTMTNAYFNGENSSGQTFCEVASGATSSSNSSRTLYAVMCYSGASGIINVLLSFVVGPLGKKRTTLLVFVISATAGVVLLFVKISLLSIALFYVFLYVALILGNVNTYLVELNPTYLRGMATCLSVVVARGFGFFSVQLIAQLLTNHCTPMIIGYVVLVSCCGFIGRNLVEYLISNDLVSGIRAVDKTPPQLAFLNPAHSKIFEDPRVEYKSANLINPTSCASALDPGDSPWALVLNCAGETRIGQTEAVYAEGICTLSSNVAKLCDQQGVRLVEISSGQMYSTEKSRVEKELKTPRLLLGAIYKHLNETMKLLWTADLKMNTVHVSDVCRAMWTLGNRPDANRQVYNVVDEGNSTQGSLAELNDIASVAEEANDKHLSAWASICRAYSLTHTPLEPGAGAELLLNKHLCLDGSKYYAVAAIGVLEDYASMNLFPKELLL